jgi:hypothetical protein
MQFILDDKNLMQTEGIKMKDMQIDSLSEELKRNIQEKEKNAGIVANIICMNSLQVDSLDNYGQSIGLDTINSINNELCTVVLN